jgi:hypothetical protein
MEEKKTEKKNKFNHKSKRKLYFGPHYSQRISELKIFIYGLRGVIK